MMRCLRCFETGKSDVRHWTVGNSRIDSSEQGIIQDLAATTGSNADEHRPECLDPGKLGKDQSLFRQGMSIVTKPAI